jgi:hypothetical protein
MTADQQKRPGGLRKIGEADKPCLSPAHNLPSHIVLEPSQYEYVCPECGHKFVFEVAGVYV